MSTVCVSRVAARLVMKSTGPVGTHQYSRLRALLITTKQNSITLPKTHEPAYTPSPTPHRPDARRTSAPASHPNPRTTPVTHQSARGAQPRPHHAQPHLPRTDRRAARNRARVTPPQHALSCAPNSQLACGTQPRPRHAPHLLHHQGRRPCYPPPRRGRREAYPHPPPPPHHPYTASHPPRLERRGFDE